MHKLHVAVCGDDHPHAHLVALLQRLLRRDGLQHLALVCVLHLVELLLDDEVLVVTASDFVHILKILPVEAAPRGTVGALLDTHVGLVGGDCITHPGFLEVAGARLGLHGLVGQTHVPRGDCHGLVLGHERLVQQQRIDGLGGRFSGAPVLGLLLLE